MKNKSSKLLVLSLAALLGVACSPINQNEESEKVGESILVDQGQVAEDDIGVAVPLRKEASSTSTSNAKLGYYFGFQKIDEEGGKISIRFVVALSGINDVYSLSIKRSVVDSEDNSVMAEKTLSVDKVYSSLKNASSITWDGENGSLDADDTYYAVYTLKNIPESHLDDVVSVEFSIEKWSGGTVNASTKANGTSFLHAATEITGLTFVAGSSSNEYVKANEVYVNASSTTLTEVEIPEKIYIAPNSYQKHVIKESTVVSIGNPSLSGYNYDGQGFYNCTSLSKIALPSTIRTFGAGCFEKCSSLTEIEFPESLTAIQKYAFGYKNNYSDFASGIKKIYWNARNLATADAYNSSSKYTYGMISWVLDKVVVGSMVESLPNFAVFGGAAVATLPAEIEWKVTEAQRSEMKASSPNSDLFSVSNYVCSDTAKIKVNYHLGEGTLELDGASRTGTYTNEVYTGGGRALAEPESPAPASGYKFTGWFLDEDYANEATFPLTLGEEDVFLYAKYEVAAPGEVASAPKALSLGDAFSFTTSENIPANYFSFTATKEGSDYYYFEISDFTQAEDSPNTRLNYATNLWAYKTSDFATPLTVNHSGPFTSEVNGFNNYQISVLLAKGETIYIKAAAFDTTESSPKPVYGDLTLKVWDYDGDTGSEAMEFSKETSVSFTSNKTHQNYISAIYKFTATQASYKLSATQLGAHNLKAKVTAFADETLKTSKGNFTIDSTEAYCLLTGLAVGSTYYVEVESNYLSTFEEGDGISLALDDLPAGLAEDNPIAATLGSSQEIVDMGSQKRYYSFTLEEGKTYDFLAYRTGTGSSAVTGSYTLTSPSGTDSTGKLFGSSTYTPAGQSTLTPSESGTYLFAVDVTTSANWSSSYHLNNFALIERQTAFDATKTYKDGDYISVSPTGKAIYNLNVALSTPVEGETAKLGKLTTYYYAFPTDASSIFTGESTITLDGGKTTYFQVSTSNGAEATITAEKASAVLEGKPYVNKQFNGCYAGRISYFKVTIDEYGTTSGEGAFTASNNVSVTEAGSTDGVYQLSFKKGADTTKGYTDGTRLYAYCGGEEWFASTATTYSNDGVGFQNVKTSTYVAGDTNPETGVEVLSVLEGSTRAYCVIVGDKVYLNATIEFAEESGSLTTVSSQFTIKVGETTIGTYKVTTAQSYSSTGTIVAVTE